MSFLPYILTFIIENKSFNSRVFTFNPLPDMRLEGTENQYWSYQSIVHGVSNPCSIGIISVPGFLDLFSIRIGLKISVGRRLDRGGHRSVALQGPFERQRGPFGQPSLRPFGWPSLWPSGWPWLESHTTGGQTGEPYLKPVKRFFCQVSTDGKKYAIW